MKQKYDDSCFIGKTHHEKIYIHPGRYSLFYIL